MDWWRIVIGPARAESSLNQEAQTADGKLFCFRRAVMQQPVTARRSHVSQFCQPAKDYPELTRIYSASPTLSECSRNGNPPKYCLFGTVRAESCASRSRLVRSAFNICQSHLCDPAGFSSPRWEASKAPCKTVGPSTVGSRDAMLYQLYVVPHLNMP